MPEPVSLPSPRSGPLVDFVIAGAQKCGTTAILAMLDKHPNVYMLPKANRDYFISSPLSFSPLARWGYERRFHPGPRHTSVGESSSAYLFYPHALAALRRYNPDLKLIVTLRNPIARAYSHWNMNVAKGREQRPFPQAVAEVLASRLMLRQRHYFSYIERGLYGQQVGRLLEIFPRGQVLFLRSEMILAEPLEAWTRLLHFLGLPGQDLPKRRVWNARPYASPLERDEVARLIDRFAADITLLSRLTGCDYSDWLAPPQPGLEIAAATGAVPASERLKRR
jgi:hypothetical protein